MQNALKKIIKRIILALFFCRKENNIYFNKSSEPHNCSREYIDNFVQGKLISTAPIRNINIINTEDDYLFDITLSSWVPIANSITLTGYDSFDSVNKAYENIKKVIEIRRGGAQSSYQNISVPLGVVLIPKVYDDITSRDFDYIWGVSLDGQVLQLMLKTGELKKSSIKLSREECFFIYMKEIK